MATEEFTWQLEELVGHNRAMLECAETGRWEKLAVHEKIRQGLLEVLFSAPNLMQRPEVAGATREMLEINIQLHRLALAARDKVANKVIDLNKGHEAVSAYIKTAS